MKPIFGSLRVSEEDEFEGLDLSQHSESAYGISAGASIAPEAGSAGGMTAPAIQPIPAREGKFA
jgi:hypothetical protein